MSRPQAKLQSLPIKELTLSEQLDGSFAAARLSWRRGAWKGHLMLVGLTLALCAFAVIRTERDLIVSQGNAVHPSTWKALTLGRFGLTISLTLLGWFCMRTTWNQARGPLEPSVPWRRLLAPALLFLPVWPMIVFAPAFLLAWGALVSGSVGLMPFSWTDVHEGSVVLLFFYWALLLPFFRLAPAIIVIEGKDPVSALARSFQLARRCEGRVHSLNFFWGILLMLLALGVALLLAPFLDEGELFTHDAMSGPFDFASTSFGLGLIIVGTLWTPQQELSFFLSYLDVRVRREGLDVELAARRAGLVDGVEAA